MDRKENILLLGAYGRLGSKLSLVLEKSHNVFKVGRNDDAEIYLEDITILALQTLLIKHKVTVVINLIAYTDVSGAEANPAEAFFSNAIIPSLIKTAVQAIKTEIYILQLSTDQLYSGHGDHRENQALPCNTYSASKYAGEICIAGNSNTGILRTNYFGLSSVAKYSSYLDWLVHAITNNESISVYKNVVFSPVGCQILCKAILLIIQNRLCGVYNFGSESPITKADFADLVATELGVVNTKFNYINYPEDMGVKRPNNMSMNSSKILTMIEIKRMTVRDNIQSELRELKL